MVWACRTTDFDLDVVRLRHFRQAAGRDRAREATSDGSASLRSEGGQPDSWSCRHAEMVLTDDAPTSGRGPRGGHGTEVPLLLGSRSTQDRRNAPISLADATGLGACRGVSREYEVLDLQ